MKLARGVLPDVRMGVLGLAAADVGVAGDGTDGATPDGMTGESKRPIWWLAGSGTLLMVGAAVVLWARLNRADWAKHVPLDLAKLVSLALLVVGGVVLAWSFKAVRERTIWVAGWVLVAAGTVLLAIPNILIIGGVRWVYEGLTGIAAAALGFIRVLSSLRKKRLEKLHGMRMEVGTIVLVGGFACGIVYAIQAANEGAKPLQGVGVMGLIVLVTSLVSGNLMSEEDRITSEEVRTALTMAIVASYLGLLAFGNKDVVDPASIVGVALKHFWQILIAVVGFYFAATTAQRFAKTPADAEKDGSGAARKPPKPRK